MKHITVVTAFSNAFTKLGVRSIFEKSDEFDIVGEAENSEEAYARVLCYRPRLLLIGLDLKGGSEQLIKDIQKSAFFTRGILFSDSSRDISINEVMYTGIAGHIPLTTDPTIIKYLVRRIAKGSDIFLLGQTERRALIENASVNFHPLSKREWEIATHIAKGNTNKEIATDLNISYSTVKNHLSNIYDKLQVRSRVELSTWVTAK